MNVKSKAKAVTASKAPPIEFYSATAYVPENSVAYLMRRVISSAAQEVERELEPSGLTNAQWVPLFMLSMGRATTAAELARECELDAGAMTRLLDRLEAKGLCQRVRSSQDRRVVNLEITAQGREAVKAIPAVLSRVQNAHLAGFSLAEWQTLQSLLRRMLLNAQAIKASKEDHAE
jgi:DNA-binding MarR family transcriptional regulator